MSRDCEPPEGEMGANRHDTDKRVAPPSRGARGDLLRGEREHGQPSGQAARLRKRAHDNARDVSIASGYGYLRGP
jgi:hypothetical protein